MGKYIRWGDPAEGDGPRPGRAQCECQHDKCNPCKRFGPMRDGWFLCGPCQQHAPQLEIKAWQKRRPK